MSAKRERLDLGLTAGETPAIRLPLKQHTTAIDVYRLTVDCATGFRSKQQGQGCHLFRSH
jgi:hypothetical protein